MSESNQDKDKNVGGRPLKFKTPEELQKKINAYFRKCDPHIATVKILEYPKKKDKRGNIVPDLDAEPQIVKRKIITEQQPYLITGLALHLGTSRETLLDYQERDGFSDAIKEAKLKCESFAEGNLYSGRNVTGSIFNLKNNYGWKDTKQLDGTMNLRRSPYEDLSDEELQQKLGEAMGNLMRGDGENGK